MEALHMYEENTGKTWVFTGGAAMAGSFAKDGCFRNAAGLFEEVIRWDMIRSVAERERFVINTARAGLGLKGVLREFETRVAHYRPAGLVYLSGEEDEALSGEEREELKAQLETAAEKIGAAFLFVKEEGDALAIANTILTLTGGAPTKVKPEDKARFSLREAQESFPVNGHIDLKDAPMRWLFIGDSITHGALHTRGADSVPQLWEKYLRELGRRDDVVINTGVSGAMARDFLERLSIRYLPYADADVVVAMFGTNDCCDPETDADLFYERMRKIAKLAADHASRLVVRTPQPVKPEAGPRAETMKPFVAAARRAAEETGAILVDHDRSFTELLRRDPAGFDACMGDAIHPNAQGQYRMFREMAYALGMAQDCPMINLTCIEAPLAR